MKKIISIISALCASTPLCVQALANDNTPIINSIENKDTGVFINWDVPIEDKSIFAKEDFENMDLDLANNKIKGMNLNYVNGYSFDSYGNKRNDNDPVRNSLKILPNAGYNNSKGAIATKTVPNGGWNYSYYPYLPKPNGSSNNSGYIYNDWKQLITNKKAIVRFKTKGSGEFYSSVSSDWSGSSTNAYDLTWSENLSAEEFRHRLEQKIPIKINNPSKLELTNLHLTTALDTKYSYNFLLSLGNTELIDGQWYFSPKNWYGAWLDCVRPNQHVTPSNERKVENISSGKPLYRLESNGSAGASVKINSNEWNNYSANIDIPFTPGIVATGSYFRIRHNYSTESKLQVDDVTFAYAPKSKLYRNGELILQGYTVEFEDKEATDKAKPNEPIVRMDRANNNVKLQWDRVEDNGSTYNYQVSSVDENNKESIRSKEKSTIVTSGIKEYQVYLNEKLISTTKNTDYVLNNISSNDKIKIVAVDNAGNLSNSKNIDIPNLITKPINDKNYIRLDWNMNNNKDKIFKVYQQKEGSNEFQSISANDYNKKVNVLNIYPNTGEKITFDTWDKEHLTLPKPASLKKWMEEPNNENSKGYGKGLIEVTPITINEFNDNPDKILRDVNGKYKYDVIMFGSWDDNGGADLTDKSLKSVENFVLSDKGVLFGHDTVSQWAGRKNFPKLEKYINVKTSPFKKHPATPEETPLCWNIPWSGSDKVKVEKQGLLTNFPWIINQNKLTIPYTHSNSQIAKGDIWMKFIEPKSTQNVIINKNEYSDNGIGTNMAYLTTYNNTAMIQTGHSNGQATPDEQKIIANTLFYLNQLSENNYLDDHSGQDVKAPDKPNIYEHKFSNDGYLTFKFNPVNDNGSKYKYYVESKDRDNNIAISNTSEATITTGVKGYSYVIDDKPNTVPDDVIEQSDNKDIKYKYINSSDKELYIHIKSIDNAGNIGETLHYEVTTSTKPTLKLELDNKNWTNKEVTIRATATTDTDKEITSIILPTGNVVNSDKATFTVSKNGKYYFKAIDVLGNITTNSIRVTTIDKKAPTVTITNNKEWRNKDIDVKIEGND